MTEPPIAHNAALFIATGFGLGSITPAAPGTLGALMGVPLAIALAMIPSLGGVPGWAFQFAILASLLLIGIPVCTRAQSVLGKKDPGEVIWDEIATVPIVFLFVPRHLMLNIFVLVLGFVLHRVFDIFKPPPCRRLERLPYGVGIMSDDIMAAVYGAVVLHVILFVLSQLMTGVLVV